MVHIHQFLKLEAKKHEKSGIVDDIPERQSCPAKNNSICTGNEILYRNKKSSSVRNLGNDSE